MCLEMKSQLYLRQIIADICDWLTFANDRPLQTIMGPNGQGRGSFERFQQIKNYYLFCGEFNVRTDQSSIQSEGQLKGALLN